MAANYEVNTYDSIHKTISKADIICTATGSTEPLIHFNSLQPHAHINAIGSHSSTMKEIANEILNQSVVIADQLEAVLSESGEIISAIEQNQLKKTPSLSSVNIYYTRKKL
ncbi:hypothetical protein [Legionella tunisiensis]|uniref:hypothetical protein n=1 Tax=Legionella tunisiensis TaxID=1034944 RepID=UPI002FBE1066